MNNEREFGPCDICGKVATHEYCLSGGFVGSYCEEHDVEGHAALMQRRSEARQDAYVQDWARGGHGLSW